MTTTASTSKDPPTDTLPRQRVRALLPDLHLGFHPPGLLNAITDVPGVLVSTLEIREHGIFLEGQRISNTPNTTTSSTGSSSSRPSSAINTGVTAILPRPSPDWFNTACYASIFSFNGAGELTGSHWIKETGLLNSPIVLTNTFSVGAGYEGIYRVVVREDLKRQGREREGNGRGGAKDGKALVDWFMLPVVGETFDGFLNDIGRMSVRGDDVVRVLDAAAEMGIEDSADSSYPKPRPVREGNIGGGCGMLTMGFKGGTGTSSRLVPGLLADDTPTTWTVGCLVQSNFGKLEDLHFGSVPVGRVWKREFAGKPHANGLIFAGGDHDDTTKRETNQARSDHQSPDQPPRLTPTTQPDGSIIAILATNAPLHPTQLQRLAKRATVGLSHVGGFGANSSGDIFMAFSTGNCVPRDPPVAKSADGEEMGTWEARRTARVVGEGIGGKTEAVLDDSINGLFEAAAECVSEAILNAMCMAESMEGVGVNRAGAIPLGWLRDMVVGRFDGGR